MAIELITGRAGAPHVDSSDVGAFQAALFGAGAYILQGVEAELVDTNNVNISAGELLCEGRHIRITGTGENLVIDNGTSAYKRNDVIALKYLRDEDGIETVQPVVIKGTPAIDSPSDPAMPTAGKLIEGATEVYWQLYRVTIDGLAPQPPVRLAQQQAAYMLGLGTEIPAGADLNDYVTPGNYIGAGNALGEYTNAPANEAEAWWIMRVFYGSVIEHTVQEIILPYSGRTYRRRLSKYGQAGFWTEWTCTSGIDSIIENGTSGNWYWEKYSSGKSVAFGNFSFTFNKPWTAWGSMYEASGSFAANFPTGLFIDTPSQSITVESCGGGAIALYKSNSLNTSKLTTGYYFAARPTGSDLNISAVIGIIAKGRWK